MRERPILFSTEMVKAILEGRKTQTRRTNKLETLNYHPKVWNWVKGKMRQVHRLWDSTVEKYSPNPLKTFFTFTDKVGNEKIVQSPYGWKGDLLWVRETFAYSDGIEPHGSDYIYKADLSGDDIASRSYSFGFDIDELDQLRYRPSIHMPKDAARIWLLIKEVTVERLQNISQEDAFAEGVFTAPHRPSSCGNKYHSDMSNSRDCGICSFKILWININGGESWFANPWVWVVKFEVLSTTGRAAAYAKLEKEVEA